MSYTKYMRVTELYDTNYTPKHFDMLVIISYLALNVALEVMEAIQMVVRSLRHLETLDNDLDNLQPLCNLVLLLPQNLPMNWMHL